jgi:hypothetical protein
MEKRKFHDFAYQISAYLTLGEYEELLLEQVLWFKDKVVNIYLKKFEFTGEYEYGLFKEISSHGIVTS